jgi:hypothetical protein
MSDKAKLTLDELEINIPDHLIEILQRIEKGEQWPEERTGRSSAPGVLTKEERAKLTGQFFALMKQTPRTTCVAPITPPCNRKPIASHSIQRAGPLSLLDDGTGHVFSLEPSLKRGESAFMKPVGVAKASTFSGLCSIHDAEMFRPIDVEPLDKPTSEQLFLLSYRTVLWSIYKVRVDLRVFFKTVKLAVDARVEPILLDFFLAHLERKKIGLKRIQKVAAIYSKIYTEKREDEGICHLIGRNIWIYCRSRLATALRLRSNRTAPGCPAPSAPICIRPLRSMSCHANKALWLF